MERISVDFKGPLESDSENVYLFTAIDEFSRFPFAIPCPDTSSKSVIKSLDQIFSLCGYPNYIHSDNAAAFLSDQVETYLRDRGVAHSKSTPYHPTGNSQIERYNGVIWKAIQLQMRTHSLPTTSWERVLS